MTEWLETDGLGGYAMGAADGIRTRRYHAWLVSALPAGGRMVLVADLEVFVETAAGRFALSSHRYRDGVVHPDGATHISAFAHEPHPRWEWHLPDDTRIALDVVMEHGVSRVALRWSVLAGTPHALHVQPLLAGRDHHALHLENPAFRFEPTVSGACVTWHPYDGVPPIRAHGNGLYSHSPDWYRAFTYTQERERGLDDIEDLAAPGTFTFDLGAESAWLVFDTGEGDAPAADAVVAGELARRARFASPLARAADAYVIECKRGTTIIAGYPWFADWGRDTFLALRGLCLATGRRAEAGAILAHWAGALSEGMLPNRFPEGDAPPEYNSVDAALWFAVAADDYVRGGAAPEAAQLRAAIGAIVDAYTAGTRHGIRADADGLLATGEPLVQLTWMDARVGDEVITPRTGKPIEVQALWFNAQLAAGRPDAAARTRDAIRARFWNASRDMLFDVVDCGGEAGTNDASCRPNQLFAIGGLPRAVLDPTDPHARAVVDAAERYLWTELGPRTLAPYERAYRPRYRGVEKDRGYHNGPAWPFLAGAFIEAWVRVRGTTPAAAADARTRFLAPLLAHTETAGLGHLPELADGDPPHTARGCPFQAWSVAEAVRLSHWFTAIESG
ncbi:MAG TPA: amylo-alpha-1,6-glucosidase [Kofleriaceae bacterium]|jgi:predicted glycogen debranching enzyme